MGDCIEQFRRHFALLFDRSDDCRAPCFQFAQIAQAFIQQAQLNVVEPTGSLLAVTGDEGNCRTFIQQGDGGSYLCRLGGEFDGEALFNGGQHGEWES